MQKICEEPYIRGWKIKRKSLWQKKYVKNKNGRFGLIFKNIILQEFRVVEPI